MLQEINIETSKLNKFIKTLGISKIEVENILKDNSMNEPQQYILMGPDPYWASYYGTISIKDL